MSRIDKLLKRLLTLPKDFTYDELTRLLTYFGYKESNRGKTSGSAVAFINHDTGHIIRLHKPHPRPILKKYQMEEVIEALRERGKI
ncbi:MAG: type II toxin-antitoxin system HicA family toxin [Deltaproteobacteria bacterium]|nr:type II toxin-antitoxin system HicA family toxin [Deltaproteobacteria bacterium]